MSGMWAYVLSVLVLRTWIVRISGATSSKKGKNVAERPFTGLPLFTLNISTTKPALCSHRSTTANCGILRNRIHQPITFTTPFALPLWSNQRRNSVDTSSCFSSGFAFFFLPPRRGFHIHSLLQPRHRLQAVFKHGSSLQGDN